MVSRARAGTPVIINIQDVLRRLAQIQAAPSVPWDDSALQYHSHVEVMATMNANVVCGDVGVIQEKQQIGGVSWYKVNFIKQHDVMVKGEDLRVDRTADRVRPGARVAVKSGVTPRRGWGVITSAHVGLVRTLKDDGQVEVDFGSSSWTSEIAELEPVDEPEQGHLQTKGGILLQIGNLVRVPFRVKTPSVGWGKISHKSLGYLSGKGADGLYSVNFPEVDEWKCSGSDLVVAPKDTIRPGSEVRVVVDNPKAGFFGSITRESVGVVSYIRYDAGQVKVDFPTKLGWTGTLDEIDHAWMC